MAICQSIVLGTPEPFLDGHYLSEFSVSYGLETDN